MLKLNFTEHLTAYMLTATNQIRSLCVYVCVCVELTHNVLLIWASFMPLRPCGLKRLEKLNPTQQKQATLE